MRVPRLFAATALIFSLLFLTTCTDEVTRTRTYHTQVPFYLSVATLRSQAVAVQAPEPLSSPGKIYIYGDFLFINETGKGIHIVDNSNPAKPQFINFINIPGNVDLAVNSNVLYADSYVDLLAFDISNPATVSILRRLENVFEHQYASKDKGLIIAFKDTTITEIIKEDIDYHPGRYHEYYSSSASDSKAAQSYGTGGSTARFTLMSGNLYTVDSYRLKLFNVANPANPVYVKSVDLGWGIETIFPYQDKLFIGSNTGMHIYDASNPSDPVKLSTYQHITSCDPVVVEGKYAYVTLRTGNFCRMGANVLEVLDVEDPAHPVRVASYPMLHPHGLSIADSKLFICEGSYGLKAFDASNVNKVGQNQLSFIRDFSAADVIAGPKSLIVTGDMGVYQYDYTNASNMKLLSHISLTDHL